MSVPLLPRPRPRAGVLPAPAGRIALATVLVAGIAVAVLAGLHPKERGLAIVVPAAGTALWSAWYGVRLILRALGLHQADVRRAPPGSHVGYTGACRSAGLLGIGFLATAVSCGCGAVVTLSAGSTRSASGLFAAGLAVAAAFFIPALLLMPGAAADPVARLRRALDAVSVGICLLFTSWVLVIAPEGRIDSLGFWIAIVTCCVLSLTVMTVLRAATNRPAVLACGGGVAAAVVGLDGLGYAVDTRLPGALPAVFAMVVAAGPVLALAGSRRAEIEPELAAPDVTVALAGYPVLAVPAAAAIGVALYRLVAGGAFDRPSVLLGIVGIVVVAVRESLGAFDVSRYARRVVAQEAQFRSLVAGSTDVIMVLDGDLIVRWQSPAAARQFGLSDQDVVGRHFPSMIHPADAATACRRLTAALAAPVDGGSDGPATGGEAEPPPLIEARLRDGFGRWRETESSINDQRRVPAVGGLVVHIRDVGERKEMERTLHRLAYADPLTGLANRRQLLLSIASMQAAPVARGALLLLELHGFTAVNDVRGFDIGDAVLVEVARRLRAGSSDTDVLARLAGDEFAVVTEESPMRVYALATRLVTMLAEPVVLPGVTAHLTANVGLTDLVGGDNAEDVLRRADLALRRAKQLGRGRVEWYDEVVEEVLVRRLTLEQELPAALARGQLDLIYQPIVDLVAGRPLGVEALLRWRHPRLGTLLPGDIIPVAEDLDLIGPIGDWVLHQASRQLAAWLREGRDLSMAVNVSPAQVGAHLLEEVDAALQEHAVPPERLVLELSEWGLAADTAPIAQCLGMLRGRGVRTALDDFGTGAESLTHLRCLPVDLVKIGRSFYERATTPLGCSSLVGAPVSQARPVDRSAPIIDVMVGLGRRLGIDVIALGLEAPAQLDVVRGAGCRLGQGHLFARPQPAERTEAYLDGFPAR